MPHTFTREELIEAIHLWNKNKMSLDQIAKKFNTTKQNLSQKFLALRQQGVNIRNSQIASVRDPGFIAKLKKKFGEIPLDGI